MNGITAELERQFTEQFLTVEALQTQARKIRKNERVSESHSLNLAAQRNGFKDYADAHKQLKQKSK